ncbi:MAG TPA: prepilin-type N-terminal cleavage/methylation domain-containing protein [Polyangiaceae bacterium]|nr:prepilin-type N-terminal cleavage/methylation domain-containing protein [Polyangiaceae bacterium]
MKPSAAHASPRARGNERGFTLTELMAVVAITGILATIGIAALRNRTLASDATSAKVVVKAIVAAEEHYRAENQLYYDVSSPGDAGWYPQKDIPKNAKLSFWSTTSADTAKWHTLAPDIRQNVSFAFKANAGLPTDTPKYEDALATIPLPAIVEPWYLIQARVDADGNGIACMVAAASWTPEVFSVNDGE